MSTDNKTLYTTTVFDSFANRSDLIGSEKFLIDYFFDSALKTVEAGTSGGRILLELQKLGFTRLWGFDYVAGFIEEAKKRDSIGTIHYSVMDATKLNYQDGSFAQAIYLQQILSCIETEEERQQAVDEAYRILCKDGVMLVSFLCLESRQSMFLYRVFIAWLRLFRILIHRNRTIQMLPWLKYGKKINWSALLDVAPYLYWFGVAEAEKLLLESGFQIVAVGTDEQILQNTLQPSASALSHHSLSGMLYFVCKK